MPIVEFHLADKAYEDHQLERLLIESSRLYAEVLACPIDRVRVFINLHPPGLAAVAGVRVSQSGARAPYFHFLVLQGRSLEERHRLLSGFTDIVVRELNADRDTVRGGCWPIAPENWAIGGVPASLRRAVEIESRASATAQAPADPSCAARG